MLKSFVKIRLKVHQRIFISLLVIGIFVAAYIGNALMTIGQLDEKFQLVTQQAVPLNKASTELLSGQADYLQLIQGIGRLSDPQSLDQKQALMATQTQAIGSTFQKLKTLCGGFKEIASVLPQLDQDFRNLQSTGQMLLSHRKSILEISLKLPKQFATLQSGLTDLKQHLIYVSEDSDIDISTETYHVVDNTAKISTIIREIYFSRSTDPINRALPDIQNQIDIISKAIEKLEATDEFDSDDWEVTLEAFATVNSQLTQPNEMLDNLKRLSSRNDTFESLLMRASTQSEDFSTKIKQLNQATQAILVQASGLFEKTLDANRVISFTLSIIVLSAFIIIGHKLQFSIKSPLTVFKNYVNQVEQGDLTRPLKLHSGDEFEETANTINNLTARLRLVMEKVSNQAGDAESTADYVVNASKKLSSVLSDQIQQVREISQFMDTLKTASEQVSGNVSRTYSQIDEVSGFTSQASKEAGHSSETVGGLMQLLTQTIQSVEQLAKDIHEIHGMTDMISNVADQTNLLALNAAIEAARAGEHGRGFAVVADEVRSLANSTQETTDIIRARIEQIVRQSDTAKHNVNECHTIAEQAHERFLSTGLIMEKIDSATAEVSAFTAQVSQAAGQQTQYITACEDSLKKIDSLAKLNAATFQSINTIMCRLKDLTQQLSSDTDYFEYKQTDSTNT